MSTDSIEKLYKNFGILADAKDKLVQVRAALVMAELSRILVKYSQEERESFVFVLHLSFSRSLNSM